MNDNKDLKGKIREMHCTIPENNNFYKELEHQKQIKKDLNLFSFLFFFFIAGGIICYSVFRKQKKEIDFLLKQNLPKKEFLTKEDLFLENKDVTQILDLYYQGFINLKNVKKTLSSKTKMNERDIDFILSKVKNKDQF